MNKRLLLNVIIVGMLTFYMIFNIVYQRLLDRHDTEPHQAIDIWELPNLVPAPWHLTRLEMGALVIQKAENGGWNSSANNIDAETAAVIVHSWQTLQAREVIDYKSLPLNGETVLAFIEEDSQPLVFRVIQQGDSISFYRMIDKKQFNYPVSAKSALLPE